MLKFIIRRIAIMIPQLMLISMLTFFLAKAMPGDAFSHLMIDPSVDVERIEELREKSGVSDHWLVSYTNWVGNIIKGDLGTSLKHKLPVTQIISQRLSNSVLLGGVTVFFIYVFAIPLGLLAGRYRNSWVDKWITGYGYVGFATPVFIFALCMLYVFGYRLDWLPTGGSVDPLLERGTFAYWISKIQHLMLPALSEALIATVGITQILRSEIIENQSRDYTKTARSKGVSETRVYNYHIARNSFIPIAANMGYSITGIIGGSVIIESIFVYPGIGRLFLESILMNDYPVIIALVFISSLATYVGTLISDITLGMVDPRIRVQ